MNINIDISEVVEEMSLTAAQAEDMSRHVVQRLTTHVYYHWQNNARKGLNSTREEYIRGLQIVEQGRLKNAIVLTGKFNNMLEQGASAFDMKIGFLNSKKVKYDKHGNPYITIPFRFSAPTSLGENSAFANRLPTDVHVAMNKIYREEGRNSMRSRDIPQPYDKKGIRDVIMKGNDKLYDEYKHKSSIFQGLTKKGDARHSQYMTFRRVSLNSDPNAFIHKGFKPRNFALKAIENSDIDNSVEIFIDEYLESL